jgi:phage gp36-like protein
MATPQYTTAERLARRCSRLGVDLATDHAPDESAAGDDADGGVGEAIDSASSDISFYCWRYDPRSLSNVDWIGKIATDLAVYYLCQLRNNQPPKSVEKLYDKAVELLTKVQDGKAVVPGAAAGRGAAPSVSNFRVDMNRYPAVRVERPRSSGSPEGYKRRTDPTAEAIDDG